MVAPVEGAIGGPQVAYTAAPQAPKPEELVPNPAIKAPEVEELSAGNAAPPQQQDIAAAGVLADQGVGANVNELG